MSPDRPHRWCPTAVLVTCEHAGRKVPESYRRLFEHDPAVLETHRGYDIGALGVAQRLAGALSAPLIFCSTTRLLVETNRSLNHPDLFSAYSRVLGNDEKRKLVDEYHTPHRNSVKHAISRLLRVGQRVLHVGVHSFTDVLNGEVRNLDIGLLFDPQRASESAFCVEWARQIRAGGEGWRIEFNKPYQGADDGLTTHLRTLFAESDYAGVEIEVRQGLLTDERRQEIVGDRIAASLRSLLNPAASCSSD